MAQIQQFAMIHTDDQWRRVAHDNTSLQVEEGVVQLAWEMAAPENTPSAVPEPAGLVFDPWCRVYHCRPEKGQVERLLWAEHRGQIEPVELFEQKPLQAGDFTLIAGRTGPLQEPRGLAVDHDGRLFIAETGKRRILIYDLIEKRLLRQVQFNQRPLDLACDGTHILVLLDDKPGLALLEAQSGPRFETLPAEIAHPYRIATSCQGEIYVLDDGGKETATIYPLQRPGEWLAVPYATDLEFIEEDVLVVARAPDQDFRRFRIQPGMQWELPHMNARHYDGRGIILTPDGRIGFWTNTGFAHATLARVRFVQEGRITSYRLDSGQFQTAWGRVFIDACIPKGTDVRVFCLVLDEPPEDVELLVRTPPANTLALTVHRPDLSPPMPPKVLVENVPQQRLHRRANGREFPWLCRPADDPYETYEAPVIAGAGRYLWLVVQLKGGMSRSPRIKSIRVEYPGHDLMRRLPRIYSRDEMMAEFLRRYLAIEEGVLRDLDLRATCRHILLDPRAAPAEVLPWLAGFIGLVLDERWPEDAKREVIENGIWLFRFRGTVMGLKRFLEIYLNRPVQIIEHFKVRGLGGAIVGEQAALTSRSVLGSGFRIGGKIGGQEDISISDTSIEDAFATYAHRFSVIIPASLSQEQYAVIDHILEEHRPAHTIYDLCTVDAGMRAGVSLYVELTTIVGRSGGFGRLQVGGSLLGRQDILGRPRSGTRIGGSRLGGDSRVG